MRRPRLGYEAAVAAASTAALRPLLACFLCPFMLRLGLWRAQWCPIGRHFALVRLIKEADLSPAELEFAAEHHDIPIP